LGAGIHNLYSVIFLTLIFSAEVSRAQSNKSNWQFSLGVGPNITQTDVVDDSLKSDIGGSLWARRLSQDSRFFPQLTFDYFKFGSQAHMENYMLGLGYLLSEGDSFRQDVVLGLGVGHAVKFPRATPDQSRPAAQARYSIEYKMQPHLRIGLALEFIAIDLDDKEAKDAEVSLPMLYFAWQPSQKTEAKKTAKDLDSDHDGVRDNRDRCPNTPIGSIVNNFGCVAKEKIQMNVMLNFASDSDVILEQDYKELKELADVLNENPKALVTIEGHTDSTGSLDHNMDLSARRAASVRKHLITQHGISNKRITSRGFGPTQPIADNETSEGRYKNRRVLAIFETQEEKK
jgi:outer membrane protein OmpA-like peptidoglycan-associated protein